MVIISVVYHSGDGHTRMMADAVLKGVNSIKKVDANLISIEGKHIIEGRWNNEDILNQLDHSDAIIMGSPTYFGTVSAQMKSFMDATSGRYLPRTWKDKVAAGFSVSYGPSGDKLSTLFALSAFAMQHGMIWVTVHSPCISSRTRNSRKWTFS